ncbi:MAG: ABC transporter permease [Hyphomicrobium sp.]|jgi:NitT/TauT family transport system permease protein
MRRTIEAIASHAAPFLFGAVLLAIWEISVRVNDVPSYLLPSPSLIAQTLYSDFWSLWPSLIVTVTITIEAFLIAAVGGLLFAILFTSSRWIERSLFPFAVILQVTPVVAIAPLIIIWVKNTHLALLVCAWLVAFFPVISNAAVGLNSTDRNLTHLFQLYGANKIQSLWLLKLPAAMPYYLAGLRISGGLALIGAVVAEFVAGTGGNQTGLAYRILESGYRLQIPRMFAALVLISLTGIMIFVALSLLSRYVLRNWHESALSGE